MFGSAYVLASVSSVDYNKRLVVIRSRLDVASVGMTGWSISMTELCATNQEVIIVPVDFSRPVKLCGQGEPSVTIPALHHASDKFQAAKL